MLPICDESPRYAGAEGEAAKAFKQRIDDLAKHAVDKSLVPADDPVPASATSATPSSR